MPQRIDAKAQPHLPFLAVAHRVSAASRPRAGTKGRRPHPAFVAAAWLAAALAVSAAASPAARAESSALLVDHRTPGPDAPPSGRSLFEALFAGGVPFPFSALLDRLKAEVGAQHVVTALVPLGRSLQRFSAHPNYFASPRLVVAITGDRGAGPGTHRLADRLYLGYQPAADVVEVLSYNEDAGRFEFQEIVGYTGDRNRQIRQADRRVCVACHQGHAPIFARPLWSETNANPAVAQRLAGLGAAFHGAPVRQSIDALAEFNASTDGAAQIALANRLWREACADARCRAALLLAALRFGLNGARPEWQAGKEPAAAAFAANATRLWPEGLKAASPDIVNRDPLPLLAHMRAEEIIETKGALNPETPRPVEIVWRPGPGAFSSAARAIAAQLAPGDFAWLDARLQRAAGHAGAMHELPCRMTTVTRRDGARELRYDCASGDRSSSGFLTQRGDAWQGRLDEIRIAGAPPLRNLTVQAVAADDTLKLTASLTGTGATLSPRLADGRRITGLEITSAAAGTNAALRFGVRDDLALLVEGRIARAEADHPVFAARQPFRRRPVLELLATLLEN
jgi:hypothetical protein